MDLSIGKLQQLVAVARAQSFSRAAADLNLSQPALSRSIAAIETRYGLQIFERLAHGVRPTAAGAQVIAEAEPLLQALRVFDRNLRLYGEGKAGRLQLGLSPLLASEMLAEFAGAFFAPQSGVQLRAMVRAGPDLLEALKRDEIELFFFPEGHVEPSADLDIEDVGAITPCCVVRSDHPLAALARPGLADLARYPWASSIDTPLPGALGNTGRFICDNYHILREAVLASDLVCICSQAFVAAELAAGALREIEVEGLPLPATTLYRAKLRGSVSSPLAEAAVRHVKAYLARSSA